MLVLIKPWCILTIQRHIAHHVYSLMRYVRAVCDFVIYFSTIITESEELVSDGV